MAGSWSGLGAPAWSARSESGLRHWTVWTVWTAWIALIVEWLGCMAAEGVGHRGPLAPNPVVDMSPKGQRRVGVAMGLRSGCRGCSKGHPRGHCPPPPLPPPPNPLHRTMGWVSTMLRDKQYARANPPQQVCCCWGGGGGRRDGSLSRGRHYSHHPDIRRDRMYMGVRKRIEVGSRPALLSCFSSVWPSPSLRQWSSMGSAPPQLASPRPCVDLHLCAARWTVAWGSNCVSSEALALMI